MSEANDQSEEGLEFIGIKVPPGTKDKIRKHCGYGKRYRDMTDFVIKAIEEKLDPGQSVSREELKDQMQGAIIKSPEIFLPLFVPIIQKAVRDELRKMSDGKPSSRN